MTDIKFEKMKDYCEHIRKYFQTYNQNNLNIEAYGDAKAELKKYINDSSLDDLMFILNVQELIGAKTRVLQGSYQKVPFLNWIGGLETFTKNHFINTMKAVWPDL